MNVFPNNYKGYYFFPIISFIFPLIFLKEKNLFVLVFGLFFLLRIIFLKQKQIFIYSFISIFLGVCFFQVIEAPVKLPQLENTTMTIKTLPDTIKIDGDLLSVEGKEISTNEKILINYRLKNISEKHYMEQTSNSMIINGTFSTQEVEGMRNLNGFDYNRYLNLMHISQKVTLEKIHTMKNNKLSVTQPILALKQIRRKQIIYHNSRFLPLTADYLNSLVLGYRNKSSDNFQLTWQSLGVAHLFSLSGMHIYFFLTLFEFLFLSLKLTKEQLFRWCILFTFFLIVMTGAGPGMMRAGIQTITKKVNQKFSFQLTPLDCWSIALFFHILIDPYVLLTVGGQLTYYLTFLILFIQPIIKKMKHNSMKSFVFSILLSWLSLPLIWYYFYEFNLLNFVLNIALTPLLFLLILPILLIGLVLSYLVPSISFIWLEQLLRGFQSVGELVNQWQFFQLVTGKIPFFLLVLVLVSQIAVLKILENNYKRLPNRMLLLVSLSCLIPFWKYANPYGMVAFVDIGQGDALFVQLPFHKGNYLVDTGGQLDFEKEDWQKKSDTRLADYTVIPFMKSRGVKQLDGVFITHAHEDHFGDLDRISNDFKVKHLLFDAGTYLQPNITQMLAYDHLQSTNLHIMKKGDHFQKNGLSLDCLYPSKIGDGQNNDSLVLKLIIKKDTLLLTGDLEKEGENELIKAPDIDLKATILKVGHHGSNTSSQPTFLEKVNPEKSIISCGKNNRYGHPAIETISNLESVGSEIYQTDVDGMIYFTWHNFSSSLSTAKTIKK